MSIQTDIEDYIIEKIEKYADEVINENKDKTIFVSVSKLDIDKILEAMKQENIECEKGEIKRKDFYYILPKCRHNSEPLAGLMLLSNVIYGFPTTELQKLKYTLKATLTWLILVKSKTFFDVYVNNFLSDDKYSYFIMNSNEFWIFSEVVKTPEFSRFLKSPTLVTIVIGDITVVAYEPANPAIPKYAVLKIHPVYREDHIGTTFEIIEVSKQIAYHILAIAYDNMKKDMEDLINNDEQLQKLVSRILNDSENS